MKHFIVRRIHRPDRTLCGGEGDSTPHRGAVTCPNCISAMDLGLSNLEVVEEALTFLEERDYPEATTILWEVVRAQMKDEHREKPT